MRKAAVFSLLAAGAAAAVGASEGNAVALMNASDASHAHVSAYDLFPCQHWLLNIDFPGNDIGSAPAPYNNPLGALLCFELCRVMSGCHVTTWTIYNGGTCWFKSRAGTAVYMPKPPDTVGAPNPTAFVIEPPANPEGRCQPIFVPLYNCDMPDNNVASVPGASLIDCYVPCLKIAPDCKAVSWSPFNGGTCWLKSYQSDCVASSSVHSAIVSIYSALDPTKPFFP